MLDWTKSGLPGLAHPAYPMESDVGPPVPAFPEVRAGWDGFCLAHAHCIGWRRDLWIELDVEDVGETLRQQMAEEGSTRAYAMPRSFMLQQLHENAHWILARSPLAQAIRLTIIPVWAGIHDLSTGNELIVSSDGKSATRPSNLVPVPLAMSRTGHSLERGWRQLVDLERAASAVEEVFSVWSSLYWAHKRFGLPKRTAGRIERLYQAAYGTAIPEFPRLYKAFKVFAGRLDYQNIIATAVVALSVTKPLGVLVQLMDTIVKTQRPRALDPDRIIELGRPWLERDPYITAYVSAGIERGWDSEAQLWFWRDLPTVPLMCSFDERGIHFHSTARYVSEGHEVVTDAQVLSSWIGRWQEPVFTEQHPSGEPLVRRDQRVPDWFWAESVRQQLTQGIGLRCPFWQRETCCGRREALVGILQHTRARPGHEAVWQPEGCLI